jgi:hypothetical protein
MQSQKTFISGHSWKEMAEFRGYPQKDIKMLEKISSQRYININGRFYKVKFPEFACFNGKSLDIDMRSAQEDIRIRLHHPSNGFYKTEGAIAVNWVDEMKTPWNEK